MRQTPPFRRRLLPLILTGGLAAWALPPCHAQVDDIQLKLTRQFEMPVRWDNVEDGRPYWLGGVPPQSLPNRPWHAARLAPGQQVAVRIPAGERIRLLRADGKPFPDAAPDLILRLSNGSGVSTKLPTIASDDRLALLADAYPGHAGVIYVERPARATGEIDVAIFVSRRMPFPTIAPYRRVHPLPLDTQTMRRSNEGGGQTYWRMKPGEMVETTVRGPARYALQGRFVYPREDASLLQGWWVKLALDDKPLAEMQFETAVDSVTPVVIDGSETPATRFREAYVEIPPGDHKLSLLANGPFLARLLEQEDPDYLFASLNEPELPARIAREDDVAPVLRLSTWSQDSAQTIAALTAEASSAEVKQAGLRLLQDNRRREGALLAAAAMQNSAARRRDEPAVQSEANAFLQLHTFNRDLLPEFKLVPDDSRYAWYLAPILRDIGERGRGTVAAVQHEDDLLASMNAGIFLPLPEVRREERRAPPEEIRLDLHFDNDASRLREADRGRLRELARTLAPSGLPVRIVGHTDSRANDAYNQNLSRRRAETVAAFLVQQGVNAARIKIAGRAAREPVADNGTEEGRQANRRASVEAMIGEKMPAPAVHVYHLPERNTPTWLHAALHADEAAAGEKVYLQFDDAPPLELSVGTAPEFAAEHFQPTTGETALLLQRWRHGEFGGSTLSAAFSKSQVPALLIPAGVSEIPLPPEVRKISAWRASPGATQNRVWLALKLRTAKPYALSETGLLAAIAEPRPMADGVATLLAAINRQSPATNDLATRDLDSHLQPLARLLRNEYRSLAETIAAPEADANSERPHPDAGLAERAALAAEEDRHWLPALEQWAIVATSGQADRRERAAQGRIRALLALGETFLAEQRLKQRLLYANDPQIRRHAAVELARLYRLAEDNEALLTLASAAFIRDPDDANLARVLEALQANGMPEMALAAGLLLPPEKRPLGDLLRAAVRSQWWQVHEALVATLPDADRHFWQAMKAGRQGRFDEAAGQLAAAGNDRHPLAGSFAAHLASGREIHQRLRTPGLASPETVDAWGHWLAAHPGEREWTEMPSAVKNFAGSVGIHTVNRDAAFTMHRAEAGQPVRLGFFGPTVLRVEARPLHRAAAADLIEGWLHVRETTAGGTAQLWAFPITQNPPASGLQIVGDNNLGLVPGHRVWADVPFGPGWHDVDIDAGALPLLVRSKFPQAELRLPVLPLLTADSAVRPDERELPPQVGDFLGCFRCTVLLPLAPDGDVERFRHDRHELGSNPARLGLPGFTAAGGEGKAAPDLRANALATGNWDEFLAKAAPTDRIGLQRHFYSLLWIAENAPDRYEQVVAQASALAAEHPEISALQAVMDRLRRRSGWSPLTSVQESAGQRSRITTDWEPENPALRIRRALLPPTGADEMLLSGDSRLALSFFNPRASRIELMLANADVSGLRPSPLRARLQVDGQPPRFVTLAPGPGEARETIALGAGEHSIRLSIESPVAGQFLRVRLTEAGRSDAGKPVLDATERFYHVATANEPVRVQLPGPRWVRIDEWDGARTESSYRLLPDIWNELELKPSAGSESLYRIFTLGTMPDQPVTPPRIVNIPPEPVPPPLLSLPAPRLPSATQLRDGLPLGGQEDGTWSVYGGRHRRSYGRAENPGSNAPTGLEKFAETGVSYRYFDAEGRAWYRADLLGRWRDQGNPTLGMRASVLHAPTWSAWNFGAETSLFMQQPGGTDGDGLAHTATLRGFMQQRRELTPKLYHLPEIAVFARHTRPGNASSVATAYREGRLDQDVFTAYRAKHSAGAELSDTLEYQPWLDNKLYAKAGIVSNKDFALTDPDHFSVGAGIRQLFGPVWTHLHYGQTHYLADKDRQKAQSVRSLSLNLGGELWRTGLDRFQIDFTLARDLTDRFTTGSIVFTWHGGNGRAYTDFKAGEIDFRDLRTRRMPAEGNNRMPAEGNNRMFDADRRRDEP